MSQNILQQFWDRVSEYQALYSTLENNLADQNNNPYFHLSAELDLVSPLFLEQILQTWDVPLVLHTNKILQDSFQQVEAILNANK